MLKQLQPSMSIDDQIKNLKSIGLSIPDEEYARRFLNDVSYYRLIKGFSIGLKEKMAIIMMEFLLSRLYRYIFLMQNYVSYCFQKSK